MAKRSLGTEIKTLLSSLEEGFDHAAWHGPNLDAVRSIFEWARRLPDVSFIVLGSAGLAFQPDQMR